LKTVFETRAENLYIAQPYTDGRISKHPRSTSKLSKKVYAKKKYELATLRPGLLRSRAEAMSRTRHATNP
jgi:hypothetical protein